MKNCRAPFRTVACAVLCLFVFGSALSALSQTRGDVPSVNTSRHAVEKRMPTALLRGVCDMDDENVEVEADGGTPQAGYATLGEAFVAINTGVHTGDIAIEICGSTTEAGPAVLNSSGAGAANYSAIQIYPLIDDAVISANTGPGRGVIELNGADNVTIDGDNPNSDGINRNLTVQNTAANTVDLTQLIRIALNTTTVASADNNTLKNMILNGNATGLNIPSGTSNTGPVNRTFGVLVGGGATGETSDPALATITSTIGTGASASGLVIENNQINSVGRAIAVQGSAQTVFSNLLVANNLIGNPVEGGTDQVYSVGITVQGSLNAVVRGNIVYVESFLNSTGAGGIRGLDHGFVATSGSTRFDSNQVRRVRSRNPDTIGASGISLHGSNNHVVLNNFVSGISNNQVTSGPQLGTNRVAAGIRIGAGTGHKIYHNSVHMYGSIPGTAGENMTAALVSVPTATTSNFDIRNNIFSNQMTGGSTTSTRHLVVWFPDVTGTLGLTLNNNAYYQGTSLNSRLAKVGIWLDMPETEYMAGLFDPSERDTQTNFRYYSSRRGNTSNDNASFATTSAPPFVSDSDLHIPTAYNTQLESGGADVGVLDDIDGEVRTSTPDIGADEITAPSSAPVILSGRVISSGFRPLSGARITVMGGGIVQPRSVTVNGFGFYRFEGLEAGQTYIVSVSARGAVFDDPIRVVSLDTDLTDLDFYALP